MGRVENIIMGLVTKNGDNNIKKIEQEVKIKIKIINNKHKFIVIIKPSIASLKSPNAIALCTHVTLKPEIINMKVLNKG